MNEERRGQNVLLSGRNAGSFFCPEKKMIVLETQKENLEIDFQDHLHRAFQIMENNLLKINQNQIFHKGFLTFFSKN